MSRKLGQHFLINKSAIKKIIDALELKRGEIIIEIGPGKGALTFPLIKECEKIGCKIIAIEKDKALAQKLVNSNLELKIIEGDILNILPKLITNYPAPTGRQELPITNYKIVGNIPYYITGKLLRLIGELITNYPVPTGRQELPITNIILMIQKEVAERICAEPKIYPVRDRSSQNDRSHSPSARTVSNGMNLLAAAVQFWAKPEILFTLKPNDFSPPPEVNSAIIKLSPQTNADLTQTGAEKYYRLIKILFKQPRKTIFNNLKTGLKISPELIENSLKSLEIDPQSRPQNLSIEQIKKLSELYTL